MRTIKISTSATPRTDCLNRTFKDINRYPLLTPEREVELAGRIAEGDIEARNALVNANLRFVISVAKQYQGCGLELADLIGAGYEGLIRAADHFDASKGFKFISYAVWWIMQSIFHALSQNSRTVRLPHNQVAAISKITKAQARFFQDNQREPSVEELAEIVDLTPEEIRGTLRSNVSSVSLDAPIGLDEDSNTLMDIKADENSPAAGQGVDRVSLRQDINDVLTILTTREADILRRSFGLGSFPEQSLDEIAQRLDLSRERVRQIKEKVIRRLRRAKMTDRLLQYL